MDADGYDLVVVGSGPAGEKGATLAAYHGKRVAMVERAPSPGGTAVATGGIPTKALRETALAVSGSNGRNVDGLAVELDRHAVFERLRIRAGAVSAVMGEAVAERLTHHRIELVQGTARLAPDRSVVVSAEGRPDRVLRADVVLLATGSRPVRPSGIPFDGRSVLDSAEILALDRSFGSIVVVGAGAVGCEYASIFATIGVQVCVVDVADHLLPWLDSEISDLLATSLRTAGVELLLGTRVTRVEHEDGGPAVELSGGRVLRPEKLLFATGRVSNTEGLGLEDAGVEVEGGRIVVDDQYRTTAGNVFAAGDAIGPPALASVAMEQARVAVCEAFGFPLRQAVDRLLPVGIYSIPEVAAVGMTEEAAARAGLDHEVGRGWFERNTRAVIAGDAVGLVKLVFERRGGRLLGVHILGVEAAELVHQGQAVIRHGGGIDEFIQTTFNVPTRSDAYKYAAYDGLKRVEARAAFGDTPGAGSGSDRDPVR